MEERCSDHSGFSENIKNLEVNVAALWRKYDGVQKLLFGALVTLAFNLGGVIIILIKLD